VSINSVAIEFYAFIAVAAWLVYRQWRGGRDAAQSEAETPRRDEDRQPPV
jgi:hypothetical protein